MYQSLLKKIDLKNKNSLAIAGGFLSTFFIFLVIYIIILTSGKGFDSVKDSSMVDFVRLKKNDFSNERRESVMDYSPEWLETLKYFRDNWIKEVYPFYNIKHYPSLFKNTKQIVGSIPIVGDFLKKQYYKKKHIKTNIDAVSSTYYR